MSKNVDLYKAKEMAEFLQELAKEYMNKEEELVSKKKAAMLELAEWEEKLTLGKQYYADKTNLFSPNNKAYDLEEISSHIQQEKAQLEQLSAEQKNLQEKIRQLYASCNLIEKSIKYHNDLGMNILEIQEKDRQRIARDLHDSTVHNLTGLVHKI